MFPSGDASARIADSFIFSRVGLSPPTISTRHACGQRCHALIASRTREDFFSFVSGLLTFAAAAAREQVRAALRDGARAQGATPP